jgi:hypothetical protein
MMILLRFQASPTSSVIVLKGWRSKTKVLEEEQFKYSCYYLLRYVNLVVISLILSFFVALLFYCLLTYTLGNLQPARGNYENILLVTMRVGDRMCSWDEVLECCGIQSTSTNLRLSVITTTLH